MQKSPMKLPLGTGPDINSISLVLSSLVVVRGFNSFGWGLYFTSKREIADFYRQKLSKESGETGHVYQVALPEENEKYLFWDKRLSEQPKAVRAAALSFLEIKVSEPIKYDWGTNCSITPNLRLSETDIQERNGRFQVFALDGGWEMRREFTNLDDAIRAVKKKIIEQLFRQTGENFYEDLKWQFNTAKDSSLALLKQGMLRYQIPRWRKS